MYVNDGPAPTVTVPTAGWAVMVRLDAPPPVARPVSVVAEVLYAIFCVARLVVGDGDAIVTRPVRVLVSPAGPDAR